MQVFHQQLWMQVIRLKMKQSLYWFLVQLKFSRFPPTRVGGDKHHFSEFGRQDIFL